MVFIGDAQAAIEVKGSSNISGKEMKGLRAFIDEHQPKQAIVVCNEQRIRRVGEVVIYPWRDFLDALWGGKLFG